MSAKACHMAKQRVGVSSYAGARAPLRGGVTRQGVVLTDLQSLHDCQSNFSLSLSLPLASRDCDTQ
jgi:hypothetical protein